MDRNPEPSEQKSDLTFRRAVARWARVWRAFLPFARRHRKEFWKSAIAALVTVACRLAFPWPLKALLQPWLDSAGGAPAAGGPAPTLQWVLPWAGLFFLITLALGLAEFFQRLAVARFSIAWVRDIRAEAFRAAHKLDPVSFSVRTGDLVARLIGDTARLKAGLKGFLVHMATNGLLFVGVTAILLWRDLGLGLVMAAACLLVMSISLWGAYRVYLRYLKLRKKEGKLADRIQEALEEGPEDAKFDQVNYSSGRHEASVVRLQGTTTFLSHAVLGIATLVAIAIGVTGLQAGRLEPGDLFIFFLYVVSLHRPAVRLSRQGTRVGKMMACGDRLERLLRAAGKGSMDGETLAPLGKELRLKAVSVGPATEDSGTARLGPLDVRIRPGQKIAIVGGPGAGKTTLLELLAGNLPVSEGKILWDGRKLHKLPRAQRSEEIGYLAAQPSWLRKSLRSLLKLRVGQDDARTAKVLESTGVAALAQRIPGSYDAKVASQELSWREARAVALARVLLGKESLVLLDEPEIDMSGERILELLDQFSNQQHATILVTGSGLPEVGEFDRIIELEAGSLVFDGTPGEWSAREESATPGSPPAVRSAQPIPGRAAGAE